MQRRDPFGLAAGLCQIGTDHQARAVLHQPMPHEAQLAARPPCLLRLNARLRDLGEKISSPRQIPSFVSIQGQKEQQLKAPSANSVS